MMLILLLDYSVKKAGPVVGAAELEDRNYRAMHHILKATYRKERCIRNYLRMYCKLMNEIFALCVWKILG